MTEKIKDENRKTNIVSTNIIIKDRLWMFEMCEGIWKN
jgi:hypothetical protein